MKKHLSKIVITGLLLLVALNVSLAQPERTGPAADRFIGFHLVPERINFEPGGERPDRDEDGPPDPLYHDSYVIDRSHWEPYGSETGHVKGLGRVEFQGSILKGVRNEEEGRFEFPGMEGYNCFLAIFEQEGESYITGYTDMTETHLDRKITEEEEENHLSAALYVGPQEAEGHWVLTAYRVYQMEDGTVYLDGTGNSYGGPGFTISERVEFTTDVNGKKRQEVLEIQFSLKDGYRLEDVEVTWFDQGDNVLGRETLDVEELEESHDLKAPAGAAWALVWETTNRGKVTRTTLAPDQSGSASHRLITLDDRGIGRVIDLEWYVD